MSARLYVAADNAKMILRILSAICGLAMVGYGIYQAIKAVISPSLRMYLIEGGSDTVQVMGKDVEMSARSFVLLVWLLILLFIAGGLWFRSFALRGKQEHDT